MKKAAVFLCLIFLAAHVYAKAIQEDYKSAEEKARVSYAFGMVIGNSYDLGAFGIEFDYDAFSAGMRAAIDNTIEPQFTDQEAMEIAEGALYTAMERRAAGNRFAEEEFLATNKQRPEIVVTESGLQYEVINETQGEKPKADSVVRVNYLGTYIDGNPFDKSEEDGGTYVPLEMVIPGWSEGLMLMSPGSIYKFYIPSKLAYGEEGIQSYIPPYSTLIFNVELLEIVSDSEKGSLF